jgi:beta-lactamase regulating signal transducer with metallopeptidase domain
MPDPVINSGISEINEIVNPIITESFAPELSNSVNPLQIVIYIASLIWITGIAVLLIHALISYIRLKKSVSGSVDIGDRLMICDDITTPFILGLFRPMIYIPSSLEGETLRYVISHENAHLSRRDHWWKPLGYLILTVYWFNPLCWLAYIFLCKDIEAACDEVVISNMDRNSIAGYSQALLDCSIHRRMIAACPLAFGENDVKNRIKGILNYRKPTFWIIMIAVSACVIVAVCLMTDPFSSGSLNGKLADSMDAAIADRYSVTHTDWRYDATDYSVLSVSKDKNTTTVYTWVLYQTYVYEDGQAKLETGSHIPTVITFDTSGTDSDPSVYKVTEYWEPRDGDYFTEDIQSKFPRLLWRKASDPRRTFVQQERNCLKNAQEYFRGIPRSESDSDNVDPQYEACAFIVYRNGHYNIGVEIHTNYRNPKGQILIDESEFKGMVTVLNDDPTDGKYYRKSKSFSNDFKEWNTVAISEEDLDKVIDIMKDHVYHLYLVDPEWNFPSIDIETRLDVVVDIEDYPGSNAETVVLGKGSLVLPLREIYFISHDFDPDDHRYVELAAPEGTDVIAAYSGKVGSMDYIDKKGYYVIIEQDNIVQIWYSHMASLSVSTGDIVKQGDVIGTIGSTGDGRDPSLEFRVFVPRMGMLENQIDPKLLLPDIDQ